MAVKKKTRLIESLKQRISLLLEKVDSTDNVSKLSKILDKEKAKRNKKLMSRIHKAVGYNKQFKKSAATSAKVLKNVKDQPPASSSSTATKSTAPAGKKTTSSVKSTVNKTTGVDHSKQSGNRAKDSASAFAPLFKKEDAKKKAAENKAAKQAKKGPQVGPSKEEKKALKKKGRVHMAAKGMDTSAPKSSIKSPLNKSSYVKPSDVSGHDAEKRQKAYVSSRRTELQNKKKDKQERAYLDKQLAGRREMDSRNKADEKKKFATNRDIIHDKTKPKSERLAAVKRMRTWKAAGMNISAAIAKMWGRLFESGTSEGAKKAWETRRKHGSLRHLIKLKTLPKRAAAAKKTEPKKVTKAVKAVVKTQPRKPAVTKAVKAVVKTNNKYLAKALTGKQSQALASEVGGWSSEMALFGMLKDMGVMNNPQIGKHNKDIETEDGKKIKYTIASNDKRYIYTRSILGGRQQLLKWHKELGMNLPKGFENYSPEQLTDYFYYFEANKDRLMKKWTKEDRRGRPPKGGYVSNKHL